MLQIYTVCWMGDRLIEAVRLNCGRELDEKENFFFFFFFEFQSTNISNGVYNSEWYTGAAIYQKHLILIIMRSHRAQTLKAYKFADASRKTFSGVSNGHLNLLMFSIGHDLFFRY